MSRFKTILTLALGIFISILLTIQSATPSTQAHRAYNKRDQRMFTVTGMQQLELKVNDFVYDEHGNMLYASISDRSNNFSNSIVPIDISTGQVGTPLYEGAEPNVLAIADDGSYLYAGLADGYILRINLQTGEEDLRFYIGRCGSTQVLDFVILENPESIAVSMQSCGTEIFIYDNGVSRPEYSSGYGIIEPSSDSNTIYTYRTYYGRGLLYPLTIMEDGIHSDNTYIELAGGWATNIKYHTGHLYTTRGKVIDPTTNSLVGTYPLPNHDVLGNDLAINATTDSVFFASYYYQDDTLYLNGFDRLSFRHIRTVPILTNTLEEPEKLESLTPNHLALLTDNNQLHLLEIEWLEQANYLPIVQKEFCSRPFVDDFSDPSSGWPILDTPPTDYGYINGEYSVNHSYKNRWSAVLGPHIWDNSESFEISTRVVSGEGSTGFIYSIGPESFYTFEIYPHLQVWVIYKFTTSWGWRVDEMAENSAIQTGDAYNRLTLDKNGNGVRLMINGVPVISLNGTSGRFGLSATSYDVRYTDIRFDDYLFSADGCPPAYRNAGEMFPADATMMMERPSLETFLQNMEE